jgi:hypothetical protein
MDRGVAIATNRTTRPTRGSDKGLLLRVVTVKPMIACCTVYHRSNSQAGRCLIISPAELNAHVADLDAGEQARERPRRGRGRAGRES